MPLTLTLAAAPRRKRQPWQTTDPKSRRLKRIALGLVPTLTTLWGTLFKDLRQAVSPLALDDTFTLGHNLDAEQELTDAWAMTVEQDARRLLPILFTDVWMDVGAALTPERQAVAGGFAPPLMETPAHEHERTAYIGFQLLGLWRTTLLSFRQSARRQRQAQTSPADTADAVAQTVGLTPRQANQVDTATAEWEAEGLSASTVQQRQDEATARALGLRVNGIAETMAFGMVALAQRLVMQQAAEAGGVTVLRTWKITDDDRLCPQCAEIPDLNPDGVGMEQPFQTPYGPVMDPPAHPACRCDVDYD